MHDTYSFTKNINKSNLTAVALLLTNPIIEFGALDYI